MTNANKFILLIILVLFPFSAFADAGIPTLALAWPAFWVLLIPIIIVEAWVGVIKFKIPWKKALKITGLANIFSTLAGIPLGYLTAITTNLFYLPPVMLADYANMFQSKPILATIFTSTSYLIVIGGNMHWQGMYLGAIAMCIPYAFFSYWLEYLIIKKYFANDQHAIAHKWSLKANLVTYSGLVLIILALFIYHLISYKP